MNKVFKWIDNAMFPEPTLAEYETSTLDTARKELAQALNDLDRSKFTVAYREAQIKRLEKVSVSNAAD